MWTASDVPNSLEAGKPLEREDMAELVAYFARSAANAADGGFDGIEIHAAHGYLLQEFLSPRHALRRSALALEVARVGDALVPRWADRAISDGHLAGRRL
ncbi:MAG: hypothetical protein RL698_2752 [Pseudomonadota bacterium]